MTKRKLSEINPQNHPSEEKKSGEVSLPDIIISMLDDFWDGYFAHNMIAILKGWRTKEEKEQGLEFAVKRPAVKTIFNAANDNNGEQYLKQMKFLKEKGGETAYYILRRISYYCHGPLEKYHSPDHCIYASCRKLLATEICSDDNLELKITSYFRNKVNDFLQEKAPDIFNLISNSGENKTLTFTSVKNA